VTSGPRKGGYKNMTGRGKLIAVEGIDGSGKRTQVELLARTLRTQGYSVYPTGFPQYDSMFGKMVGQFLNGEFGPLESVDPHFTALLYAGDRCEAKPKLEAALSNGQIVLADRYIGSNLAHQSARVAGEKRAAFVEWIERLEYGIYELPREDLVVYLRVPAHEAQKLVALKSVRSYTSAQKDLQEASLRHLEDAAAIYDSLSRRSHWAAVECFDAKRGTMRPPEQIGSEVLAAVESVLASAAAGKGG
jgi:dTMP kinase